jgi:L-threonylcarbamoyladenylate synthase
METLIGKDLEAACRLLREGQVVAIPTETVYGLAGHALNPDALALIFTAKGRPRFNPLIMHLASWSRVADYVLEVPEFAERLAERFMPGPLTLLLPKHESVPDLLTAGSPFVAIRIPAHPTAHDLLNRLDFPLAAPSANPFGYISPTTAAHVYENLGGKIAYILDGGTCAVGIESTIVGFDEVGQPLVYREGGLSRSEMEKYSGVSENLQMTLSAGGDLNEAAQHLFAAMRRLDQLKPDRILAEMFPNEGLGPAINDRLMRAAAKSD